MILLHAAIVAGRLVFFGESPLERAGRPRSGFFPYDAGVNGLNFAFAQMALAEPPGADAFQPAWLWVPCLGEQPIPSSPLIADAAVLRGECELKPLRVTVARLGVDSAFAVLRACAGKRTVVPGVVVSPELWFFHEVLRYAVSLVAREHFLPAIEEGGRARWNVMWNREPSPGANGQADDAAIVDRLAASLPPIARALAPLDDREKPQPAPRALLRRLIEELVDELVRAASPLLPHAEREQVAEAISDPSLHEAWLAALKSGDGTIDASADELRSLRNQLENWRRPLETASAAAMRLCFRLEPPVDPPAEPDGTLPSSRFFVRYLLQPDADPSRLIPLQDALADSDETLREAVFSWLGQAAAICPRIEASLHERQPVGYEVEPDGAFEFLTVRAAALEQAGFGVLLPGWWTERAERHRLMLRADVDSPALHARATLSLDNLVRFQWKLALGEEALSQTELDELAAAKAPLVRFRGRWIEVNRDQIAAAADFLERRKDDEATVRDLMRLAFVNRVEDGRVPFAGVRATGWIGMLLQRLEDHAALEVLDAPAGFHGQLRPYQVRGFSWLAFLRRFGLGACLADDMGLGKTVQALALLQRCVEEGEGRPVLLVCPTSVVNNWKKEAERFTPGLKVLIHHGVQRNRGDAFVEAAQQHHVVLSSYALLHRDFDFLSRLRFSGVILDEAQNIKNPETKQSRAAKSIGASFRAALTGTPVENHLGDLWSIMEFLNPGLLGTETEFRRNFFVPIQAERDAEAERRLRRLTAPFVLRRLKTDRTIIADLPEKQEMKVYCPLTREQASLYAAVLKETEGELSTKSGIARRGLILATLTRLKQVCNHPAHFLRDGSRLADRSGKLSRITEMVEEILDVDDRALVFTQFAEMGHLLKQHLQESFGREVLFLHGGTPKAQRDQMVDRFQAPAMGPPLFVLSLKAGGFGLNLTRANHVFHFDRWWNPAVENQATDRAYRIGQERNVQVHKLICAGTLEEKIDELIESKRTVAETIIGGGEEWLTELSNADLKAILELRPEAIGD